VVKEITIEERMKEENQVREKIDKKGNKWREDDFGRPSFKSREKSTRAHLLRKRRTMLHPALLHRKWVETGLNSCKELNLSFSSQSEIGWC